MKFKSYFPGLISFPKIRVHCTSWDKWSEQPWKWHSTPKLWAQNLLRWLSGQSWWGSSGACPPGCKWQRAWGWLHKGTWAPGSATASPDCSTSWTSARGDQRTKAESQDVASYLHALIYSLFNHERQFSGFFFFFSYFDHWKFTSGRIFFY